MFNNRALITTVFLCLHVFQTRKWIFLKLTQHRSELGGIIHGTWCIYFTFWSLEMPAGQVSDSPASWSYHITVLAAANRAEVLQGLRFQLTRPVTGAPARPGGFSSPGCVRLRGPGGPSDPAAASPPPAVPASRLPSIAKRPGALRPAAALRQLESLRVFPVWVFKIKRSHYRWRHSFKFQLLKSSQLYS